MLSAVVKTKKRVLKEAIISWVVFHDAAVKRGKMVGAYESNFP
jgi:CRISPR/Cas system-associated endonuclease Cas3-HD